MQATIHNEFLTLTVDTHGAEAVSLKNAAGEELLWTAVLQVFWLAVLILLTAIIVRCLMVAKNARNTIESCVCVGVAAVLIFQTISNVGMCLFVMPVVGLTLPFFSYGGTALSIQLAEMGIVLSVSRQMKPTKAG